MRHRAHLANVSQHYVGHRQGPGSLPLRTSVNDGDTVPGHQGGPWASLRRWGLARGDTGEGNLEFCPQLRKLPRSPVLSPDASPSGTQ